jgi:hypothetical protein
MKASKPEERRILFPERLQASVRANRGSDGGRCDRLAAQRCEQVLEAACLLADAVPPC